MTEARSRKPWTRARWVVLYMVLSTLAVWAHRGFAEAPARNDAQRAVQPGGWAEHFEVSGKSVLEEYEEGATERFLVEWAIVQVIGVTLLGLGSAIADAVVRPSRG